ncbi:MAG: NeuD/PglB/VioB family sugar acetyltransferase [Lachnospiraceae bacterium]|nr:NeuD/PglB/VioB family sugar acetyltransferase [Lachnospiraceae bacterium]
MSEKVLGIWGAGGLGREVLELARIINNKSKRWDDFVFIVDGSSNTEVNGIQVMEYESAKKKYVGLEVAMGIGEPTVREKKFNLLKEDGVNTPSLIHPDVYIPDTTKVGQGTIIQYGCFISCNVTIGDYVYIQPQCNIGHDDKLAEGCMIAGFGNIAGRVSIGKYTYLGLSAVIKEDVNIGNKAVIGMGSVVYKDVPDEMVALGSPARPMARNTGGNIL